MKKGHRFSYYHPLVIFLYFAGAVGLTMCTLHLACIAVSFFTGGCYAVYLKGFRRALKNLLYYLPLLLVISVVNPLFNGLGLTVLFYVGGTPFTMEALTYGLSAGGMLVCVLQWFSCYQAVMSGDKFLGLFSKVLPTLSMMVAMIFRYIPVTIRKSQEIRTAQSALLGMEKQTKREKIASGIRMASILMSWSMESSIETADSMRSRGYGTAKRSRYTNERLTGADVLSLVILLCLIIASGWMIFAKANEFRFYPTLSGLGIPVPAVALYALLLLYPLVLEGKEQLLWKRSDL